MATASTAARAATSWARCGAGRKGIWPICSPAAESESTRQPRKTPGVSNVERCRSEAGQSSSFRLSSVRKPASEACTPSHQPATTSSRPPCARKSSAAWSQSSTVSSLAMVGLSGAGSRLAAFEVQRCNVIGHVTILWTRCNDPLLARLVHGAHAAPPGGRILDRPPPRAAAAGPSGGDDAFAWPGHELLDHLHVQQAIAGLGVAPPLPLEQIIAAVVPDVILSLHQAAVNGLLEREPRIGA